MPLFLLNDVIPAGFVVGLLVVAAIGGVLVLACVFVACLGLVATFDPTRARLGPFVLAGARRPSVGAGLVALVICGVVAAIARGNPAGWGTFAILAPGTLTANALLGAVGLANQASIAILGTALAALYWLLVRTGVSVVASTRRERAEARAAAAAARAGGA
jgi:hypothetical protein